MTDTAGPFDGAPWAEAQWARHAAAWAPSGVYGSPAASTTTGDLPLSVSGRSVGLGAGRAWVRGFGFERTGSAVMVDPGANTHASFSRRDRTVLRRNLATHTITQVVIQGTPASSPAAPALTQSETGSWDIPLFSFLVPPNSGTSITGIIDERGWVDPAATGPLAFGSDAARDANLPSPTKGELCTVAGVLEQYDGSSWKSPAAQPKWSHTLPRGGGDTDSYVGDGSLISGTWSGAPAGDYLVHLTLLLIGSANAPGTLAVTAGGSVVSTAGERADVTSAFVDTLTRVYPLDNFPGGDLAASVTHSVASATTIVRAGSKMVIEYLGRRS